MNHLLQISDLTRAQIESLIDRAEFFRTHCSVGYPIHLESGKENAEKSPLGLLFCENSTRTRVSFELAGRTLGIPVINLNVEMSSVQKGESLQDTVQTLEAMGIQCFVIRHSQDGIPAEMAKIVKENTHIINAGDGQHAHPTQALLDMMTLHQHKKSVEHLSVGILGDSLHSRVAKSDAAALKCLGCRDIRLIGPKSWLMSVVDEESVSVWHDDAGLKDLDVVITLRVQKERMKETELADLDDYIQQYQLNSKRLAQCKPNVLVMHPGPINRGVEIDPIVADGAHSAILQQVRNGVMMRMAVIEALACFKQHEGV